MNEFIFPAEFLDAVCHLREMTSRVPLFGFKIGEAVAPEDTAARLVILNFVLNVYKEGLLNRLMEVDPFATRRLFNDFMDDRRTFDFTVDECIRRAEASGPYPTKEEWISTGKQLVEAWQLQYIDPPPVYEYQLP
jgi:hypothetical protein